MTAEIINLNKVRKARERAEAEREAANNRVRFGRSKADRRRDADEERRKDAGLDGAKRDDDHDGDLDPGNVS